jgi:4-alpha-glucanotransferase
MRLPRCAGFLIPLFSLRTTNDLGRGEIGGLVPMADFGLAIGHRLIQLLPIDEIARDETSPYTALSVFAIDPMYISVRTLPGINKSMFTAAQRQVVGAEGDFARLGAIKRGLLERAHQYFTANADSAAREAYNEFVATNAWVRDYALFRALKEKYEWRAWETWPEGLKRHDPAALGLAARESSDRVAMYSWFQYVAHWQWLDVRAKFASRRMMVSGDLAFSPGRESVEVWANQDVFDLDRSVGAPPDAFSATGQRWGLPMPNWRAAREDGFKFLRSRVRRARELYDAVRIDHVVGLFRTFGYPMDETATGAFDPPGECDQLTQGKEILEIIIEEAGPTTIIAEDLGVIPPFVREVLASLRIPGYKVMRWEKEGWDSPQERFINPAKYPEVSLATTGTHDTETLAEWWRDAPATDRQQLAEVLKLDDAGPVTGPELSDRVRDRILEVLYASPARIVIVPIQDLFGWDDRINTPGTINDANWRWRLPFVIERALADSKMQPTIEKIRAIATRSGRFAPGSA